MAHLRVAKPPTFTRMWAYLLLVSVTLHHPPPAPTFQLDRQNQGPFLLIDPEQVLSFHPSKKSLHQRDFPWPHYLRKVPSLRIFLCHINLLLKFSC